MERVEVNKLKCRYPTLFKMTFFATGVWLLISIANSFGHWLLPERLDHFGMNILELFAIASVVCFFEGLVDLFTRHKICLVDQLTRKVASYTFFLVFGILLIMSIWQWCGASDDSLAFSATTGRSISLHSLDGVASVLKNAIQAALCSAAVVAVFLFVKTFLYLFTGRIRKIGIEILISIGLLTCIMYNAQDYLWLKISVVLIAFTFLYDIWKLADFQSLKVPDNWMERLMEEFEEHESEGPHMRPDN